jgi:dTDP-4-amino-4,6-dideoxygalactose transaminase
MEELRSFASAHGLALFEDCAQAHGTRLAGRGAGTFGNAASWSFYPTKNLGAIGDGGAVTTDDPEIAARLKRLRLYGYATRNDSQELGWNSRLDELQAAFLRERLALLPAANARRAAIAARYDAELSSVVRTPRTPAEDQLDAHHLYVVRVPERTPSVRGS